MIDHSHDERLTARMVAEEAMALVAVGLFCAVLLLWSAIISGAMP